MKRRKRNIIIGIILLLVISITIGYAFLNDKLNITGNSQIKENSWVIYFDNIVEREDNNVIPTDDATITNFEKTQIDFSVSLTKPGEKYEFIVDIKNDGSIDAVIDSVTKSGLDEETAKYLDFDVTYLDGTPLQHCDLLKAQSYRKAKAIVKFKKDITEEDLPKDAVNLNLSFSIHYVQSTVCDTPIEPKENYTLYINPNGGEYTPSDDEVFNEETGLYEKVLSVGEEFTLGSVAREYYIFHGWDAINNDGYTTHLNKETNTVTMDENDAYVKANFEVQKEYVARIEQVYYETIQAAFDDAKEGDMIYLLRDTEESPTNYTNADITLNLDGFRVVGTLTNEGMLRLVNLNEERESYFINEEGYGAVNNGTFTLGYDDEEVKQDGIALIGKETLGGIGLKQNGVFNFYDGYLEGYIALDGLFKSIPVERYVFIDHNDEKNCQRGYLIERPDRAIAKSVEMGCTIFYFNLQDALNSSMEQGYEIYAIRDFEGAYSLEIYEDKEALFDITGFIVETGYTITNNGTFTIRDSATRKGEFKPSVSLVNNGDLNIETIEISGTTDRDVIKNNGNLNIVESRINALDGYAINIAAGNTLTMDDNTYLTANDFALYCNTNEDFTVKGGHIGGVHNTGNLVIEESTHIDILTFGDDSYGIKNDSSVAKVTLNNVDFDITNSGPNTYAVYNANSNSQTIVNGGNYVVESTYTNSSLANASGSNIFYGGRVTVNDGVIKAINNTGAAKIFYDVPSITINGGELITEGKNTAIVSASSVDITNGTLTANGTDTAYIIYNYDRSGNHFNVSGTANLTSNHTCAYMYNGTVTVDGGTLNCKEYFVEGSTISGYNWSNGRHFGTVNINGGEITAGSHGIYGRGQLNMNGGTLTATQNGFEMYEYGSYSGDVLMSGGTIKSLAGYGIHAKVASSTITLQSKEEETTTPTVIGYISGIYSENNGVTIKSGNILGQTQYGVDVNGPTTIGVEDKDIKRDIPEIRGLYYGLFIRNNVYVDFFDGILKGITHGYSGIITGLEDASQIYEEGEDEYEGLKYNNCYLIDQENYVRVGDVEFNALQKAINYIETSGTIVVIKDHDIKNETTLPAGKDITLDFDGHNLFITKSFTNNGTLKMMTSTANDKAGISSNVTKPIVNNGTLTIESAKYNTIQGMLIHNTKSLTVNGGTLLNESTTSPAYIIYNEIKSADGAGVTVNDGTLSITGSGAQSYGIYSTSYRQNGTNNVYPAGVTVTGGKITATSTYAENFTNNDTGAITLYGGNILVENGTLEAINNAGNAKVIVSASNSTINNGTLTSTGKKAIVVDKSSSTVNGGTLTSTGSEEAYDFYSYDNNSLVIETNNNPIINSSHICAYIAGESFTVNGGTFTCGTDFVYGSNGPYSEYNFGTVNINGGEATAGNFGFYGRGTINMTGGVVTSTKTNMELFHERYISTVNMTGGSIISREGYGINSVIANNINVGMGDTVAYIDGATTGINLNAGTLNVNKAVIIGKTEYGVYSNGTTTFGIDEGNISIEYPSVRGYEYGVVIKEGTTTNINDGIYKGTKYGYNGFISGFPDATTITEGEEDINGVHFITNYLIAQDYFLRVGDEYFNSLQLAIDYIDEKNTIYVIANHNIKTDTVLPEGKDITLEFDGHTLISSKIITNLGKLTLEDSGENTNGGIAATQLSPISKLIDNKGTLTINGGNYYGLDESVIYNENILIFNDGIIYNNSGNKNVYGVYNNATSETVPNFIMEGGTIEVNGTGTNTIGIYSKEFRSDDYNYYYPSVTINGGIIDVTSNYKDNYYNYLHESYGATDIYGGIVTINGGSITSNNEVGSSRNISNASVIMNNGTLDANGLLTANVVSSNFTMNHGITNSNGIDTAFGLYNYASTDKKVNINFDSTINSNQVCLNLSGGTSTITGGTLNCGTLGIYGYGSGAFGHVTMTGGVINASTDGVQGHGTLEMSNGIINSVNNGLNLNNGSYGSTITMTGGTIESSEGYGIYSVSNYNNISIGSNVDTTLGNEPYVYGYNNGVYLDNGSLYLGIKDNKVNLTSFAIQGGNYGVYNASTGSVYFYDGIVKGFTYGYFGTINEIEGGTYIFEDKEIIDDYEYVINYLVKDTDIVRNVNTGKLYSNLELAFVEASALDKLELIDNVQLYYDVVIPNTTNVELDWNGYSLVTTRTITNNGTVKMYDSSSEKLSTATTTLGINILINNGTMDVTDIDFYNNVERTTRPIANGLNGRLTLTNVNIKSVNNIQNDGMLIMDNCNLDSSNIALLDNGVIKINNINVNSKNYGVYLTSNASETSTMNNVTIKTSNSPIYKYSGSSKLVVTEATLNGYIYNAGGTLEINNATIDNYIRNSATLNVTDTEITDGCFQSQSGGYDYTSISNSGTMTFDNVTYTMNSSNNGIFTMVQNNGTFNSLNSTYDVNRTKGSQVCSWTGVYTTCWDVYVYGINGNGNINTSGSTYNIYDTSGEREESRGVHYYGINIGGSGKLTTNGDEIHLDKGKSIHGINSTTVNKENTMQDTKILVENSKTLYDFYLENGTYTTSGNTYNAGNGDTVYGLYAKTGTYIMETGTIDVTSDDIVYGVYVDTMDANVTLGIKDGDGTLNPNVHNDNPRIKAIGKRSGIGLKKENGFFRFYDGIIIGNTAAKPDTTTEVEYNYEATNFYDDINDYIFCSLEYMKQSSTSLADYVVVVGNTYYRTLDMAFAHAQNGDTVRLIKAIEQNGTNNNSSITLDLHGFTLGGTITNNGTLTIIGGQINALKEDGVNHEAIINSGTLYLGINDNEISYDEVVVLSDGTALVNTGDVIMYDGIVRGKIALEGRAIIPPYYGVVSETITDDNYENIQLELSSYTVGSIYEYDYTGREEVFVAPVDGYYELQTWGAQGGSYNDRYVGGYGAYSKGVVYLHAGDILYINVGGEGKTITNGSVNGGYNGGGSATANDSITVGSGGGATHIATQSGVLSTFNHQEDKVLIASGGGGGALFEGENATRGGDAKGIGQNQSSTFGMGVNGTNAPGGGAGYFGGTTGQGGSSTISNEKLETVNGITKVMYTYKGLESKEESTKTVSTVNVSSVPTGGYAKSGNGYAKITILSSIKDAETYQVVVNPSPGYYQGSKDSTIYFLKPGESITLGEITSDNNYFTFREFESNIPDTLNKETNTVTMGHENIIIETLWDVDTNYIKARVDDEYYETLADAFAAITSDNTIYLLADTEETITNDSEYNIKLDLGTHKLTGTITNNGTLNIINGCVENTDGIAFINNGTLDLGVDDKLINTDSVSIIGTEVALKQNGVFNFYDGFLEGDIALDGLFNRIPNGYTLFADRNFEKNCQKLYLMLIADTQNPTNAIAEIEVNDNIIYYYNLQDAINFAAPRGLTIKVLRNFTATYSLYTPENRKVILDINGFNVTTGTTVTNNGELTIIDSTKKTGTLNLSASFTNRGTINFRDIIVSKELTGSVITNYGNISLVNTDITTNSFDIIIDNYSSGNITSDNISSLSSSNYAIYNHSTSTNDNNLIIDGGIYNKIYNEGSLDIDNAKVTSIYNTGSLVIGENTVIRISQDTNNNVIAIHNKGNHASLILNGGIIEAEYFGIANYIAYGIYNENNNGTPTNIIKSGTIKAISNSNNSSSIGISGGIVTIQDINMEVDGKGNNTNGILNATVTINGGELLLKNSNNPNSSVISGTVRLNNMPIITSNQTCLSGNVIVNSGTFNCDNYGYYGNSNTFEMNSGTITSKNDAIHMVNAYNATITSGVITSNEQTGIYYQGYSNNSLIINNESNKDVYTTINGVNGIVAVNSGNMNLDATIVNSSGDYGVYTEINTNIGQNNKELLTTINNNGTYGLYIKKGNTKVYDSIIEANDYGIYNEGKIELYDGNIKGINQYGIYTIGDLDLGTHDQNVKDKPNIIGGLYGLYIKSGYINYYDGVIFGQTNAIFGDILGLADGYEISISKDNIDEQVYEKASLIEREYFLKVGDVKYNSLQKAIDSITDVGKIELIKSTTMYSEATFPSGKSIVFDLAGYTLNANKQLINNGNVTFDDSSEEKLGTLNYTVNNFITNNNILTIRNGTYKGERNFIYNNKKLDIDDAQIIINSLGNSVSAIYNNGVNASLNVKNGTIDISYDGDSNVSLYAINNVNNNGYSTNIINNIHIKVNNTNGNTIAINNGNITMSDGYIEVSGNGTNTYNMYNVNATITGVDILLNSNNDNAKALVGTIAINESVDKEVIVNSNKTCLAGNVVINQGTYTCGYYGYYGYGNTFEMSNGSITATESGLYLANARNVNITGGIINSTNSDGILYDSSYTLNVNSSSLENSYTNISGVNGIKILNGTLNIQDAIINGTENGIYSTATINVGINDEEENEYPIITGGSNGLYSTNGTINIYDGTFKGLANDGINTSSNLNIGSNNTDIMMNYPLMLGEEYGLNVSSGIVNFYDGIAKGLISGHQGFVSGMPKGYTVRTSTETIDSKEYHTSFIAINDDFVKVGNETFNSLDAAIVAVSGTGTMELIASAEVKTAVTFPNGKNITLDLAGYTLTTTKQFTVNGHLDITDSSDAKSGGISYNFDNCFVNNNVLNIKGGTFVGPKTFIYNNKEVNIDNGTIMVNGSENTNIYGIHNALNSTLTMNNGTIDVTYSGTNSYYASAIWNEEGTKDQRPVVTINDGILKSTATTSTRAHATTIHYGNIIINDGYVEANGTGEYTYALDIFAGELNDGTIINHGTDANSAAIYGPMTINNNPLITSDNICIKGTITLNGGTLDCSGYGYYGTDNRHLIMTGGSINSKKNGIMVSSNSTVTISGGSIISQEDNGIYYSGDNLIINSDDMDNSYTYIEGNTNGVYIVNGSNNTILDSEIVGNNGYGVYTSRNLNIGINDETINEYPKITGLTVGLYNDNATVNVYDGTIHGQTQNGISSKGTLTIGVLDEINDISLPEITGDLYGLYISSGNVNYYDGVLSGQTYGYSGSFNTLPPNTYVYETKNTVNDKEYYINYLAEQNSIAVNKNTNKYYNNLEVALEEASNLDTIELLDDILIYDEITNDNVNEVILDMKGHYINISKSIINNGKLSMINSNDTIISYITSDFDIDLLINNNKLEINNIELRSNSTSNTIYPLTNNTNSTMTLNNVTMNSNFYGIKNDTNAILNINDSNINTANASIYDYGKISLNNVNLNSSQYAIYTSTGLNGSIINSNISDNKYSIYKTNSTSELKVSDTTINSGQIYNSGKMVLTNNTINDNISNDNTMDIVGGDISKKVVNNSTMTINDTNFTNTINTTIDNLGNLVINNIVINSTLSSAGTYYGIKNTGTISINDSEITLNKNHNNDDSYQYNELLYSTAGSINSNNNIYNLNDITNVRKSYNRMKIISNQGSSILTSTNDTLNGTNSDELIGIFNVSSSQESTVNNINIDIKDTTIGTGLYLNGSGTTINGNNKININSIDTSYGINMESANVSINGANKMIVVSGGTSYGINNKESVVNLISADIDVSGKIAYGINLINAKAELTVGTYDGTGLVTADVSTSNPIIKAIGTEKGTGINIFTGTLNLYDGKIIGNTDAISRMPNLSEPNYELSIYYDDINDYEYGILEYMKSDNPIKDNMLVRIDDTYYKNLTLALNKAKKDDVIVLLKNIEEDAVNNNQNEVTIDLNKFTLTGTITNNGNLTIINGKVDGNNNSAIINSNILSIGIDDDEVYDDIALESNAITVVNNGEFYIYDGHIKGLTAISGNEYLKPVYLIPNMENKDGYEILTTSKLEGFLTDTFDYEYTGEVQEFVARYDGYYEFELWGAASYPVSGKGAYTKGKIYLTKGTKFYIYVGGSNGYNGGGSARDGTAHGGGATDARLIDGATDDVYGLRSRIMVAAGGGSYGALSHPGSDGGALNSSTTGGCGTGGEGATQLTSGGLRAQFGIGGDGISASGGHGGAGGGGYYGGGGATADYSGDDDRGGAGGSSYISGHLGSIALKNIESNDPRAQVAGIVDDSYHYSGYIFTNTKMISGSEEMPQYDSDAQMIGNKGNGHAIVKLVEIITLEEDDGSVKNGNTYKYLHDADKDYYTFTAPEDGIYTIELWGAASYPVSGKGAYTKGDIYLTKGTTFYIYVGSTNGYNGGGSAWDGAAHGGGATDIRLVNGQWNATEGLASRIMVAAGGGSYGTVNRPGTSGGALSSSASSNGCGTGGNSATQISSGSSDAKFGIGGNGTVASGGHGGAGGGGYYGGGGVIPDSSADDDRGGSGGSSYISGHQGSIAIISLDDMTPRNYVANSIVESYHYSGYKFTNTNMISGDNTMPSVTPGETMTGNGGNGMALITIKELGTIYEDDTVGVGKEFHFLYNESYHEFIVPKTGTYKVQLWGASSYPINANGAYTEGKIHLNEGEKIYLYIGGANGYNGGGSAWNGTVHGGGATDVRLVSGEWNNSEGLASRIMVAAGAGSYGTVGRNGTSGGALTSAASSSGCGTGGYSATQISGGSADAKFGIGGNGTVASGGHGGAGGGGYYGGGGVIPDGSVDDDRGGSGGSSYISGHEGSIAINGVDDITPKVQTYTQIEDSYHYSGYVFTETKMASGSESMPGIVGEKTGNVGNGLGIITYISED